MADTTALSPHLGVQVTGVGNLHRTVIAGDEAFS